MNYSRLLKFETILSVIISSLLITSCTDHPVEIHIDKNKKAIIYTNGDILKEVRIEGGYDNVEYEGVDTIYFNRKVNASRITVSGQVNNDYILKLKPNSTYNIKSYSSNGDQGPYSLILNTDNKGNIVTEKENSYY
jgi:hypothetical protein